MYQRFVVLLPDDTVADSLKSLLPLVAPALDPSYSSAKIPSAGVQIKNLKEENVARQVLSVLQSAGYREARIQGTEVSHHIFITRKGSPALSAND